MLACFAGTLSAYVGLPNNLNAQTCLQMETGLTVCNLPLPNEDLRFKKYIKISLIHTKNSVEMPWAYYFFMA